MCFLHGRMLFKNHFERQAVNSPQLGCIRAEHVAFHSLSQGGSVAHIMKFKYPDGLDEVAIATIIKPVLKALEYIHKQVH